MEYLPRPTPKIGWFPMKPIQNELQRIQSLPLDYESKNEMIQELAAKLKTVKTIKTINIHRLLPKFFKFNFLNPFVSQIQPRIGHLATSIGAEAGSTQSVHLSTGYSNFFYHNEYVELSSSVQSDTSPKFSLSITHDLLETADYSLNKNFYTTYSTSAIYEVQTFKKCQITSGSLSTSYQEKGSNYLENTSLSIISEDKGLNSPPALYSDPSPYFKFAFKVSNNSFLFPQLSNFLELSYLFSKHPKIGNFDVCPVLKNRTNYSKFFPKMNLKFSGSAGFLLSPKAVPFAEKFKIGGVPFARGIENEEFSGNVAGFPSGCDMFLSQTLEFYTPILPQYNLSGHFFANGAISANLRSNNFFDAVPQVSKALTVGTGLVFVQNGMQIELNTQMPVHLSKELNFVKFQFGISPL